MRLRERALARGTVALSPRSTAGMPVGTHLTQLPPASIRTAGMGTKVPRGVDLARASVGRGIGASGTGGGDVGGVASCSPRGHDGLCVRPANGVGALERWRRALLGSAGRGGPVALRLGQPYGSRPPSHRSPTGARWEYTWCGIMANPPDIVVSGGILPTFRGKAIIRSDRVHDPPACSGPCDTMPKKLEAREKKIRQRD